jgi:hypothetical protein
MSLKGPFSKAAKKLGIALSGLTLAFTMTACGPSPQTLGPAATDAGLRGSTAITMVYKDAAAERVLTVDGASLKAESRYVYDGTLVVRGDIPSKTEIDVTNGKLEVTGNVGSGSTLDVRLPVLTHTEDDTILMPMTMSCGENCTTTILMPMPSTRTVEDGLAHPGDTGAAVKVDGQIGDKVTITTNGGIEASSWGTEFKAATGYGRTLQQTPAPRTATPSPLVPGA